MRRLRSRRCKALVELEGRTREQGGTPPVFPQPVPTQLSERRVWAQGAIRPAPPARPRGLPTRRTDTRSRGGVPRRTGRCHSRRRSHPQGSPAPPDRRCARSKPDLPATTPPPICQPSRRTRAPILGVVGIRRPQRHGRAPGHAPRTSRRLGGPRRAPRRGLCAAHDRGSRSAVSKVVALAASVRECRERTTARSSGPLGTSSRCPSTAVGTSWRESNGATGATTGASGQFRARGAPQTPRPRLTRNMR
jgi:hypothetical protein